MSIEQMQRGADLPPSIIFDSPAFRSIESYERELAEYKRAELELRQALARDDEMIRHQDAVIRQQDLLGKESDHRLLNGLQMIVSLLSLQSRASANTEAATQLAIAANRVGTIERVHRRLHGFDGTQLVAFKHYLEDFCRDFSAMLSADDGADRSLVVEGVEVNLPTNTGISLAFIVNELVTNAAKYGKGRITVRLEARPGRGYVLSVSNDGPGLPEGFDPASGKGLGLRLIRSLVAQIDGELLIGRGDRDLGTRFTVLFG
jgi:two-component sensor histidine kinase